MSPDPSQDAKLGRRGIRRRSQVQSRISDAARRGRRAAIKRIAAATTSGAREPAGGGAPRVSIGFRRRHIRNPLTARVKRAAAVRTPINRSEEHTSELQSLMRISYAVFCLKKKNTHRRTKKK